MHETLTLIAGIKGIPASEGRSERAVRHWIGEVGLEDKAHWDAAKLSGGQKRRLSVAMALIGDPKLVFLDEACSGMDVNGRHRIWRMLERYKRGRVIVLSTHVMHEAEWLGDQIVVLSRGKVQTSGTSLQLKTAFGVGYHLTCMPSAMGAHATGSSGAARAAVGATGASDETKHGGRDNTGASAGVALDVAALNAIVRRHVPEAFEPTESRVAQSDATTVSGHLHDRTSGDAALASGATDLERAVSAAQRRRALDPYDDDDDSPTSTSSGADATGAADRVVRGEPVQYTLPLSATARFPALFDALDACVDNRVTASTPLTPPPSRSDAHTGTSTSIGLGGYGVSVTSLEEVFHRLEDLEEQKAAAQAEAGGAGAGGAAGLVAAGGIRGLWRRMTSALGWRGDGGPRHVPLPSDDTDGDSGGVVIEMTADAGFSASRRRHRSGPRGLAASDGAIGASHGASTRGAAVSAEPSVFAMPERGTGGSDFAAPSAWRRTKAVVRRRLTQTRRDRKTAWVQVAAPVLVVLVTALYGSLRDSAARLRLVYDRVPLTPEPWVTDEAMSAAPLPLHFPFAADSRTDRNAAMLDRVDHIMAQWGGGADDAGDSTRGATGTFGDSIPALTQLTPASSLYADAYVNAYLSAAQWNAGAAAFGTTGSPSMPSTHQPWTTVGEETTLLYNTSLTNGLPVLLAMLDGAELVASLKAAAAADGSPDYQGPHAAMPLQPGYQALPATGAQLDGGALMVTTITALYLAIGFSSMGAVQALNVVREREAATKAQQIIMGVGYTPYWAGMWLSDVSLFVVTWLACSALLPALHPDAFKAPGSVAAVSLLLLAFGFASPGLPYALSFGFKNSKSAQTFISLLLVLSTFVLFSASVGLSAVVEAGLADGSDDTNGIVIAAMVVGYLVDCIPPVGLAKGVYDVMRLSGGMFAGGGAGDDAPPVFSWGVALRPMVVLLCSAVLWFAVVLGLEQCLGARRGPGNRPDMPLPADIPHGQEVEDDDVAAERARVQRGDAASHADPVVATHLRKVFYKPKFKVAVADLSLGLAQGECFGLLGPNGSGKTTAINLLTGQVTPTYGAATVGGNNVLGSAAEREAAHAATGFCAQGHALFPWLTGRETLRFYCELKGMPPHSIEAWVTRALDAVGLLTHSGAVMAGQSGSGDTPASTAAGAAGGRGSFADKLVKHYSGGTKRKLSIAVAFVGAPAVVFLDEPGAGVDPGARRRIWSVLRRSMRRRTLLLTTHLLEECEANASRVGIMVDGRIRACASPARLRAKYGAKYKVEVEARAAVDAEQGDSGSAAGAGSRGAVDGDDAELDSAVVRHVTKCLSAACPAGSEATLTSAYHGRLRFDLPANVSLAAVFRTLEALCGRGAPGDGEASSIGAAAAGAWASTYSVSQPSLEDVFAAFTSQADGAASPGGNGARGSAATATGISRA